MRDDQRARLRQAKLASLARSLGHTEPVPEPLGGGAVATCDQTLLVLQDHGGPDTLGAALVTALRRGASSLVLFCDEGAGVAARLASRFDFPVRVMSVEGAASAEATADPMPVVLPGPEEAEAGPLLDVLASHGLEVVLESGEWRGELLGLEVARVVRWPIETGGDGLLHLEAGVGRFDRDAAAAMHAGEAPEQGLRRAIAQVAAHRFAGAPVHPLSLLARGRWLRAVALGAPATVGAATLVPVETTFPGRSVREDAPAAAMGTTVDGRPLVVVVAASGLLALPALAADTGDMHEPGAVLRLVVPAGGRVAAVDDLASLARGTVEVVEVPPAWG